MASNTKVEKGTEIRLVLADGKHQAAKVIKLRGGDRVDLEADLGGSEPLVITSSPRDDSGKQADSWHLPEEAAEPKEPKEPTELKEPKK
jgi:hypothetical protein